MDQVQDFVQRLLGPLGLKVPAASPSPTGAADGTRPDRPSTSLHLQLTSPPDFADFAAAPAPEAAAYTASSTALADTAKATLGATTPLADRPYTAWYKVWERTEPKDFITEAIILPFILLVVLVHLWGTRKNRRKVKAWAKAHIPILESEFASVGFERANPAGHAAAPEQALKKVAENEYLAYASGRLNIALLDVKIVLAKRFNPLMRIGEEIMGFFIESLPAPREVIAATVFCFDGSEHMVSASQTTDKKEKFKSTFDGFVFAVVHKEKMKQLRDSRYDLSLTSTKDHAKLPAWATVMSESAEVTDALLTPELIDAVTQAGERLEALIVTDSPIDRPRTLNELEVKKRVSLALRVPASDDYAPTLPLFRYFLRLPDLLAERAKFRPEALRRVRETRAQQLERIRKTSAEEGREERRLKLEKEKREEREKRLKGMSADEQRKYLERERASDMRKGMKKRTVKG